jgi:hypothetical protein
MPEQPPPGIIAEAAVEVQTSTIHANVLQGLRELSLEGQIYALAFFQEWWHYEAAPQGSAICVSFRKRQSQTRCCSAVVKVPQPNRTGT